MITFQKDDLWNLKLSYLNQFQLYNNLLTHWNLKLYKNYIIHLSRAHIFYEPVFLNQGGDRTSKGLAKFGYKWINKKQIFLKKI
jgi:hypothetical protein